MDKPWFSDVSLEQAHEEIARMGDVKEVHRDGVSVYRGIHPTHGEISVIIPPFGESMILFFPI
jgi:hypothetical protein